MGRLIIVSRYLGNPVFGEAFAPREVILVGDYIPETNYINQSNDIDEYTKHPNVTNVIVSKEQEHIKQGSKWNNLILTMMNQKIPNCIDSCLTADIFEDIPIVCQRFVNALINLNLKPDDEIYLYGLNLILLPKLLREAGKANKLYVHIGHEVPADEILRILPECEQYLSSLLCSNVIMVQSEDDVNEFKSIVGRILGLVYSNAKFLASEYSNGYEVLCKVSPIGGNLSSLLSLDSDYFCKALGVPVQNHQELIEKQRTYASLLSFPETDHGSETANYIILAIDTTTDDPNLLKFRVKTIEHLFLAGIKNIEFIQIYASLNTYGSPFPLSELLDADERYSRFKDALAMIADLNARYGTGNYIPIKVFWTVTSEAWDYIKNCKVYWHAQSHGNFSIPILYSLFFNDSSKYLINEFGYTGYMIKKTFGANHSRFTLYNVYDIVTGCEIIKRHLSTPNLEHNENDKLLINKLLLSVNIDDHVNTVNALHSYIQPYIKNQQKVPKLIDEQTLFKFCRDNIITKYKYTIIITSVNETLTDIILNLKKDSANRTDMADPDIYDKNINTKLNEKIREQRHQPTVKKNTDIPDLQRKFENHDNEAIWDAIDKNLIVFYPFLDVALPSVIMQFDQMKNNYKLSLAIEPVDKHSNVSTFNYNNDYSRTEFDEPTDRYHNASNAQTQQQHEDTSKETRFNDDQSKSSFMHGNLVYSCDKLKCAINCPPNKCNCIDQRNLIDMIVCDNTSGGSMWYETSNICMLIENGHAIKRISETYFTNQTYFDNSILDPIRDLMLYYKERTPCSYILESYTNITFYIEQYIENNFISLNQLIGHLESGGLLKDERLSLSRKSRSVTVSIDRHMLRTSLEQCIRELANNAGVQLHETAIITLGNIPINLFKSLDSEKSPFIYPIAVSSNISMAKLRLKNHSSAKKFLSYLISFYDKYKRPLESSCIPNFGDKLTSIRNIYKQYIAQTNDEDSIDTTSISGKAAAALVEEVLGKIHKN